MQIQEQQEERLASLREQEAALQELLASQGWEILQQGVRSNLASRRQDLVTRVEPGMDGLIDLGRSQSEMAGMQFMYNFPGILLDDVRGEIQGLLELMAEGGDNE